MNRIFKVILGVVAMLVVMQTRVYHCSMFS